MRNNPYKLTQHGMKIFTQFMSVASAHSQLTHCRSPELLTRLNAALLSWTQQLLIADMGI